MNTKLPKVLLSHRIGGRGEAFLEFIMSKDCLMNKIAGHRDVGVDYICEWLNGDTPSRILFGIQVKTSERDDITLSEKGIHRRINELMQFEIKPFPFKIDPKTIEYWEGLNMPLYLFLVIKSGESFDCYYSRLTPVLHEKDTSIPNKTEKITKGVFYKANKGSDFISVVKKNTKDGGFVRDLFIDSVRCSYQSGGVSYRNPEESGINWPKDTLFPGVLAEPGTDYLNRVKKGLSLLESNGLIKIADNFEERVEKLNEGLK